MPYINKAYDDYKQNQSGLIILSAFIDAKENDTKVKAWITKNKAKYPAISPAGGGPSIGKSYNIEGIPWLILIKPDTKEPYKVVEKDIDFKQLSTVLKKYPISMTDIALQQPSFGKGSVTVDQYSKRHIRLTITQDGYYGFQLFNTKGALIDRYLVSYLHAGANTIQLWDEASIASGIYLFTIIDEKKRMTRFPISLK